MELLNNDGTDPDLNATGGLGPGIALGGGLEDDGAAEDAGVRGEAAGGIGLEVRRRDEVPWLWVFRVPVVFAVFVCHCVRYRNVSHSLFWCHGVCIMALDTLLRYSCAWNVSCFLLVLCGYLPVP